MDLTITILCLEYERTGQSVIAVNSFRVYDNNVPTLIGLSKVRLSFCKLVFVTLLCEPQCGIDSSEFSGTVCTR